MEGKLACAHARNPAGLGDAPAADISTVAINDGGGGKAARQLSVEAVANNRHFAVGGIGTRQ
jgi:hypothetical protein